jgi:hypothetical protein
MTESMDAEDYSFFLAYGMTQTEEELYSLTEALSIGDTTTDSGTSHTRTGTDCLRFEEVI